MFIFYKRFCSFCAENESACSFWFALGWLAQPSQGCERLQSVGVGLAWHLMLSIFGIEIGIGIDRTTKSLWCFKSYVCHWAAVVSEGGTGKHLFFGFSSGFVIGINRASNPCDTYLKSYVWHYKRLYIVRMVCTNSTLYYVHTQCGSGWEISEVSHLCRALLPLSILTNFPLFSIHVIPQIICLTFQTAALTEGWLGWENVLQHFHHIWVCDWDRDVHDMSHGAALKYLSLVVRRLWMKWKPSKRFPCLPGLKFT